MRAYSSVKLKFGHRRDLSPAFGLRYQLIAEATYLHFVPVHPCF